MKKIIAVWLGLAVAALAGCVSMDISGAGNLGDVDLGAHVDPINGNVGMDANKTFSVGGTETTVGASSDGKNTHVNTNVQHHSGDK